MLGNAAAEQRACTEIQTMAIALQVEKLHITVVFCTPKISMNKRLKAITE